MMPLNLMGIPSSLLDMHITAWKQIFPNAHRQVSYSAPKQHQLSKAQSVLLKNTSHLLRVYGLDGPFLQLPNVYIIKMPETQLVFLCSKVFVATLSNYKQHDSV